MTDNFKLNKVAKANRARQHFGGRYYHFIIIKGCLLSRVRNNLSVNVIDSMQCTAYKKTYIIHFGKQITKRHWPIHQFIAQCMVLTHISQGVSTKDTQFQSRWQIYGLDFLPHGISFGDLGDLLGFPKIRLYIQTNQENQSETTCGKKSRPHI